MLCITRAATFGNIGMFVGDFLKEMCEAEEHTMDGTMCKASNANTILLNRMTYYLCIHPDHIVFMSPWVYSKKIYSLMGKNLEMGCAQCCSKVDMNKGVYGRG